MIPDPGDRPARFPDDLSALEELIVEREIEFLAIVSIAFGFDCMLVPGATPKNPASGLMA